MGTPRDPFLHDTDDVTTKRRHVGFYFPCQSQNDAMAGWVDRVVEHIPADLLPRPAVVDHDSLSGEVAVPLGQGSDSDVDRPQIPTVEDNDDDEENPSEDSQDTGEYTLPEGFPFHDGDSEKGH